jgi:hypothetical protein
MDILQLIFLSYILRAMYTWVSHSVTMLGRILCVFMQNKIYKVLKPVRLKHNCHKWANICQVVNCPRRSKYYNWWNLLGFRIPRMIIFVSLTIVFRAADGTSGIGPLIPSAKGYNGLK